MQDAIRLKNKHCTNTGKFTCLIHFLRNYLKQCMYLNNKTKLN